MEDRKHFYGYALAHAPPTDTIRLLGSWTKLDEVSHGLAEPQCESEEENVQFVKLNDASRTALVTLKRDQSGTAVVGPCELF